MPAAAAASHPHHRSIAHETKARNGAAANASEEIAHVQLGGDGGYELPLPDIAEDGDIAFQRHEDDRGLPHVERKRRERPID